MAGNYGIQKLGRAEMADLTHDMDLKRIAKATLQRNSEVKRNPVVKWSSAEGCEISVTI